MFNNMIPHTITSYFHKENLNWTLYFILAGIQYKSANPASFLSVVQHSRVKTRFRQTEGKYIILTIDLPLHFCIKSIYYYNISPFQNI